MLGALKFYFKLAAIPILYICGLVLMLFSAFKEAKWGFLLLVFMIPQPNLWYKFHQYPFGKDYLDLLFLGVLLGIFIQKKGFVKTNNVILILFIVITTFISLCNSSMRFSLPLPISYSNMFIFPFKNYVQMMMLYILTINIIKNENDQKNLIILICFVVLFIAIRNYRNFSIGSVFSYEKRADGPFWVVGLGCNHMGAFFAHFGAFF